MDILEEAKKVLQIEKDSIQEVSDKLDESFIEAINVIMECNGRIIIMGVGKSGQVGRKISSTLASTGTPSYFVHPGEGIHGDLGIIAANDVVVLISNSGETEEIIKIIPAIKKMGLTIISMTGKKESTMARYSDVVLDVGVSKEASPLEFVPTSSTTATLAYGDALASVLIQLRGFKSEDFAFLHPGGSIGKRLILKVDDVMHSGKANAIVNETDSMKQAVVEISTKGLGATSVIDNNGRLVGIITDGDLRRALERFDNLLEKDISEVMTRDPIKIESNKLAAEAVHIMENRPSQIMVLPVIDMEGKPIGMVRIHDLVKAGVD